MAINDLDVQHMARALELAERGRGLVEPNPPVGAVLVQNGRIVGEGWHQRFGEPHAEINALAAAGETARGATLYLTLEPCCHQGKTPPCTAALLRAGITRVVAAMEDPFPEVSGQGTACLRAAGVTVEIGLLEARARRLNAPYLKLLATGRPYVHAKWAMTLDGKIATRTGESRWISGESSRRLVHELRGRMDALLVGIGTVLADDPLLTARPPGPRTPVRIVLDSKGRLPLNSRLLATAKEFPTLLVTAGELPAERADLLRARGCELLAITTPEGRPRITPLLDALGKRRMTNLLVEGGAEVLGSFLDAREIDEIHVFLTPRLLGGAAAPTAVAGRGVARLAEAYILEDWQIQRMDGDLLLHGWR